MKRHFILLLTLQLLSITFVKAQEPVLIPLFFSAGVTGPNPEGVDVLRDVVKNNNKPGLTLVLISAYADVNGDEKKNQKIADQRTFEIRSYNSQLDPASAADQHLDGRIEILFEYGSAYKSNFTYKPSEKNVIKETEEPVEANENKAVKKEEGEEDEPVEEVKQNEKVKPVEKKEESTVAAPIVELPNPIFTTMAKKPQLFKEENAKYEITITGKEGTIITIPKQSLVDSKEEVVKDLVQIELKEFYKRSDIILANLNTVTTENELLQSAGMIYINVTYKGESLHLKNGASIQVEFKPRSQKINTVGMTCFVGDTTGNHLTWREAMAHENVVDNRKKPYKSKGATNEQLDSTFDQNMLYFESTNLHWINCDRFNNKMEKTNLTIKVDSAMHAAVSVVFRKINGIMPAYHIQAKSYVVSDVPANYSATIVAVTEKNKELYFAMKEIVTSENKVEEITLVKTTAAALKVELAKLDKN